MKLNWKYVLGLCILCFVLGVIVCQPKPETHTVTVGGLSFTEYLRDPLKPRFPHFIFIKGKDGETDTFIVYKDTPIGEIPIQERSGTFNIPLFVNSEPDSTWWGSFFFSYQGIGDSIKIEIPQKDITLKTYSDKKFLTFRKSLSISIDTQKRLLSEMKVGLAFGDRLAIFGGLSYRSDNEFTPTVGLQINF